MVEHGFYTVQPKGILLRVKAKPGAHADGVAGVRGGELMVTVRAVAEKGRATAEITRVIADALGLPRAGVVLKSGGTSPHKVYALPSSAAAALEKLARALLGKKEGDT